VVGTTDTAIESPSYEPRPLEQEIEFVLETAGQYLSRRPKREDILSIYTGIRPLVKAGAGSKTSALSRDHTIHIEGTGLLTIVGGKWTTYRHMAEDCVDHAITLGSLDEKECLTQELKIHGYPNEMTYLNHMLVYGSDVKGLHRLIDENPSLERQLHPELPYIAAEVVWAVREEMARTVEDVLARRTRALFLNTSATLAMAEEVASLMAGELNLDSTWIAAQLADFRSLADRYLPGGAA
jgi:glycerol-3-phosphate dehydrogenase